MNGKEYHGKTTKALYGKDGGYEMKALFIGGTGTISMGIVRRLSEDPLWEVYLLNRGNRKDELAVNALGHARSAEQSVLNQNGTFGDLIII